MDDLKNDKWETSMELTAPARSIPNSKEGFWNRILQDRFSIGVLAGFISYVPQLIWLLISKSIGFSDLIFADFSGTLVYGRFPQNNYEYLFAEFVVLFWHSFHGVLFAFLLILITSKNLLLKSWFYGMSIWFASYVITYLYQVPELSEISLHTSITNAIGASIQGLFLGYAFIYLQKNKLD